MARRVDSTTCGIGNAGGAAAIPVLAKAITAQIAQKSSECRSESWLGAGNCCVADIDGAACVTMPWKWPNESTHCTASANNATRAPCLMFDRSHFMLRPAPEAGTPRWLRRYNITSQARRSDVNRPRRKTNREFGANAPAWRWQNRAKSAPLANPGCGERAEQQQQANEAGEHRQHTDASDDARVTHLHAQPAVAPENA
jgi:hypothetical protein